VRDPLLQAIGLYKHYRSGTATVSALRDVSLTAEQGEFLAITGRSGSGKSTLMNILGLLVRPDSGGYILKGRAVETLSADTHAAIRNREIGFIFQSPTLLPRATALENVELPLAYAGIRARERRRRAEDALDRVGLTHRRDHRPHQLSGGEQQRVAIARAIVNTPILLLADEPTGALDTATGEEILSLFQNLNQDGRTVIVVTHDASIAARARRQVMLEDGRILTDETSPRQIEPVRTLIRSVY
jgi:putative ABC transport system ATP-binding protein